MNKISTKILTLFAYISMVLVNYLAISLPLAGRDTGAISDSYPNLFAPAGYTFSIWGIIYTLLGSYVIYQFSQTKNKLIFSINKIFIVNAFLNALWIFAWHYDFIGFSVLIMLGLLFTLIKIADVLNKSVISKKEAWFVRLPFGVYFGWITVATIANIATFLVSVGWNGFGLAESFWTIIVLLTGVLIGVLRMWRDRIPAYGMVLVWAYGGILSKHLSSNGFAGAYKDVISTVVICMLIIFTSTVLISFKRKAK